MPHPREDAVGAARRQRDPDDRSRGGVVDVDVDDVARGIDQTLGQREAVRQVVQVLRRRHQHGIADAVELQRDRQLHRDLAPDVGAAAVRIAAAKRARTARHYLAQATILTGTDLAAGTWLSWAWCSTGISTLHSG